MYDIRSMQANMMLEVQNKGGFDFPTEGGKGSRREAESRIGRMFQRSGHLMPKDYSMDQDDMSIQQFIPANGYHPVTLVTRGLAVLERSYKNSKPLMTTKQLRKRPRYTIDTTLDEQTDRLFQTVIRPRQSLLDSESLAINQLKQSAGIQRNTLHQLPMISAYAQRAAASFQAMDTEAGMKQGVATQGRTVAPVLHDEETQQQQVRANQSLFDIDSDQESQYQEQQYQQPAGPAMITQSFVNTLAQFSAKSKMTYEIPDVNTGEQAQQVDPLKPQFTGDRGFEPIEDEQRKLYLQMMKERWQASEQQTGSFQVPPRGRQPDSTTGTRGVTIADVKIENKYADALKEAGQARESRSRSILNSTKNAIRTMSSYLPSAKTTLTGAALVAGAGVGATQQLGATLMNVKDKFMGSSLLQSFSGEPTLTRGVLDQAMKTDDARNVTEQMAAAGQNPGAQRSIDIQPVRGVDTGASKAFSDPTAVPLATGNEFLDQFNEANQKLETTHKDIEQPNFLDGGYGQERFDLQDKEIQAFLSYMDGIKLHGKTVASTENYEQILQHTVRSLRQGLSYDQHTQSLGFKAEQGIDLLAHLGNYALTRFDSGEDLANVSDMVFPEDTSEAAKETTRKLYELTKMTMAPALQNPALKLSIMAMNSMGIPAGAAYAIMEQMRALHNIFAFAGVDYAIPLAQMAFTALAATYARGGKKKPNAKSMTHKDISDLIKETALITSENMLAIEKEGASGRALRKYSAYNAHNMLTLGQKMGGLDSPEGKTIAKQMAEMLEYVENEAGDDQLVSGQKGDAEAIATLAQVHGYIRKSLNDGNKIHIAAPAQPRMTRSSSKQAEQIAPPIVAKQLPPEVIQEEAKEVKQVKSDFMDYSKPFLVDLTPEEKTALNADIALHDRLKKGAEYTPLFIKDGETRHFFTGKLKKDGTPNLATSEGRAWKELMLKVHGKVVLTKGR